MSRRSRRRAEEERRPPGPRGLRSKTSSAWRPTLQSLGSFAMLFDLSGKTALVTGASGGLGGAIARALHAQGATVALSGTRREALDKIGAELGEGTHGIL